MTKENPSLIHLAESICTTGYLLGQITGLNLAAKLILDRAEKAFSSKKDGAAHLYRDLATTLTELSALKQKEWDRDQLRTESYCFETLTLYENNTNWQNVDLEPAEQDAPVH